ncbi:MAG: RIP metalloprotease RseP [Gammaproteobacteria bacterium]
MSTIFYFVLTIGILVSFHEFGHFWVARRSGVKVLRFSVGFGKVLWSYQKSPDATEYVVSAIPLGGYVKMVDEREGEVKDADLPFAFNRQSVWVRTAIVAAGPVFNLGLALALFWMVLVIGETGMRPILGEIQQGTIASESGFTEGDEILSVNDKNTPTWSEALNTLIELAMVGRQEIGVHVKNLDGREHRRIMRFAESETQDPEILFKRLGFKPWVPKLKPVIGDVLPDSAALAAGLKRGDRIVSADGDAIADWMQWVEIVKSHPGVELNLVIERENTHLQLSVTPRSVPSEEKIEGEPPKTEGKIGAAVLIPDDLKNFLKSEYSLSPLAAIPAAFEKTYSYSYSTLKMMAKMLIGQASVKNLSGPISIAQYAGQSASIGWVHFIKFIALVSVSLGVLNLLPIPVLDGGHLMFYGIEALKGSPVSENIQAACQQIGIALLISLMALVMVLDVQKLFQ